MIASTSAHVATWVVAAIATGGVIVRPWGLPEAVWACVGALVLVVLSLLPLSTAAAAVAKGLDVYLFLIGMMLLAELAREEGLFDWLAAFAVRLAAGSQQRLFALVFAVGILVTVFLSNDATAVVLTPAVYAAATAAGARPIPYLYICAFIANAASFMLPISNPANLVLYAGHMPSLFDWLAQFAAPSVTAIAMTYGLLRWTQRAHLVDAIAPDMPLPHLSADGKWASAGIAVTAVILLVASAFSINLGGPTLIAAVATAAVVSLRARKSPRRLVRGISWSVLPLVGGLFVLVAALEHTGVIAALVDTLRTAVLRSSTEAAWQTGLLVALATNLINNLPAGLIAAATVAGAHPPSVVAGALLIGVDLGPNLSVTGSLATILWLVALRREKLDVGAFEFLRLGVVVMVPALVVALAVQIAVSSR